MPDPGVLCAGVREFAARSVLCWLAMADAAGRPNVSPKEVFAVFDAERLVIANIASPTSFRNIEINPRVCVGFVDVFARASSVETIIAPSYRLYPLETTEQSQVASALRAYGVKSADDYSYLVDQHDFSA